MHVLLRQHLTLTQHRYYTYDSVEHSWIMTSVAYGVSIIARKIEAFMEICKKKQKQEKGKLLTF